jgi:pimeloyl-ACP methyl ester carboxylesterase
VWRRVIWLSGSTLAVWGLACGVLYSLQDRFIYAPPSSVVAVASHELVTPEGGAPALFLPPPSLASPVVVYLHGNNGQVGTSRSLGETFRRAGAGFLALEYAGYGLAGASGPPSEAHIVDRALRTLEALERQGRLERARVVLAGQSLGTGVAVALAARGWGRRMLLVSPFLSLPALGAERFPWAPVRWLMRDRYDSALVAPEVAVPVLVAHGIHDEVVPYAHGEALARRFPRARLLTLQRGHSDAWDESVTRAAVGFLVEGAWP